MAAAAAAAAAEKLPLSLLNALLETEHCAIVQTLKRGRGIISTKARLKGEIIIANSEPLAIAYSKKRTHSPWTLPPETMQFVQDQDIQAKSYKARQSFREEWPLVFAQIYEKNRLYPTLAAQIATRLALEPSGAQSAYGLILAALCAPKLEEPFPAAWMQDRDRLLRALERIDSKNESAARRHPSSWLTSQWYAQVIGRLHLNLIQATDTSYSALWALPSFLNHDPEPSLLVDFSRQHSLSLIAARDIQADEELTISYLAETFMQGDQAERDRFLFENYGFIESSVSSP